MSLARTTATSARVARQLRNDPRTIALLLVLPSVLMGLLAWILSAPDFDKYGPALLGIFPLIVMFLVTSVATVRERTGGTLERLLSMPIAKSDFVFGYAFAFGASAIVQSLVVAGLSLSVYGLDVRGPSWAFVVMAVANGVLGTALGLFASAFAATEFQAVQFFPALLLPQLLLCGIIVPRDELPPVLEAFSALLPLSYTIEAVNELAASADATAAFWGDVAMVAAFAVAVLLAGTVTLRRRTP
jgi:ABC-2 type transport system permease protein